MVAVAGKTTHGFPKQKVESEATIHPACLPACLPYCTDHVAAHVRMEKKVAWLHKEILYLSGILLTVYHFMFGIGRDESFVVKLVGGLTLPPKLNYATTKMSLIGNLIDGKVWRKWLTSNILPLTVNCTSTKSSNLWHHETIWGNLYHSSQTDNKTTHTPLTLLPLSALCLLIRTAAAFLPSNIPEASTQVQFSTWDNYGGLISCCFRDYQSIQSFKFHAKTTYISPLLYNIHMGNTVSCHNMEESVAFQINQKH